MSKMTKTIPLIPLITNRVIRLTFLKCPLSAAHHAQIILESMCKSAVVSSNSARTRNMRTSTILCCKLTCSVGGVTQAPRDKLVCILNCCRVINNLLHVGIQDGEARGAILLLSPRPIKSGSGYVLLILLPEMCVMHRRN